MEFELTRAEAAPDERRIHASIGLGREDENPQEVVRLCPAAEATQVYVQAYYEALEGYRKRHEAVERYSALLNR